MPSTPVAKKWGAAGITNVARTVLAADAGRFNMLPNLTRPKPGMFSRLLKFNRHWLWGAALLTAVGAPVAITSNEDVGQWAGDTWGAVAGNNETGASAGSEVAAQFPARPAPPPKDPIEGPPTSSLAEVFRFDVTTAWVMGRWPRVSTGMSDVDLQGYRVPLVTGTREHDLAGALTYYFNRHQRLEKITFRGTTGDARPLVATMAQRHGFLRRSHSDPAVHYYGLRDAGGTSGEMRIRPSRVVRRNQPHKRFDVELQMSRSPQMR